jgi:long-chain fatty acid transport protein
MRASARCVFVIALGLLCLDASPAFAAAFELREFDANAMGTAYAGAASGNDEAGYLFYNPAALGGVQEFDGSVTLSGLILDSNGTFTGTTAFGTPTGGAERVSGFIGDALIPAFAMRYRLTDQIALGLTFTTPFGESTHYPDGWTGRYFAQTTDLVTYNLTPTISYDVLPELTLAAGAQIQYSRAYLTEAIDFGTIGAALGIPGAIPGQNDGGARLRGHAWGAGFVLGALWHPMPSVSVGVSYISQIPQALRGQEVFDYDSTGIAATINALSGAFTKSVGKADAPTPAMLHAGARWSVDDHLTLLGGFEYTNWSTFHQLLVESFNPANPDDLTLTNWKNTWFGSLGAEYRIDDQWTVRAGTGYDMGAIPSETVTPRIPDASRWWLSAGFGYRWRPTIDFNFAVSQLFAPHSDIDLSAAQPGNTFRGNLVGVSNVSATLVSAQLVIR